MSAHSRRSTLYGPHAVLHRHRRPHAARPQSKETTPMKPTQKQQTPLVSFAGQGRYSNAAEDAASAIVVCSCVAALALFVLACFVIGGAL